ncbi:MAG: CbiQ family ECF transporter T component, partial [Rhodoferax sp.]
GMPLVLVAILGMAHRYLFVLLHTAGQMLQARRSRLVAPLNATQQRQVLTNSLGVLLGKSFQLSTEVHLAMVSRGWRGEVHLLHEFRLRRRDRLALALVLAVPLGIVWLQP